jgi:hypothetical protein
MAKKRQEDWLIKCMPIHTTLMYCGARNKFRMVSSMIKNSKNESSTRTSVTFPPDVYRSLENIAKKKKVSTAWVIREAAERYISDQTPLFADAKHE